MTAIRATIHNHALWSILEWRATSRREEFKFWAGAVRSDGRISEVSSGRRSSTHAAFLALHGAQCYDEAIQAFQIMMTKLDDATDVPTQKLRQQYLSPSEVAHDIRQVIDTQLENAPFRTLGTITELLCD
ncbi:uncharacterized protein HD556DRAFT_1312969 [Suillus plorans]|uniref:Uncharacterized protein n=1 Tax=Suillus plorans TaxID=116603 RepID=A0A9P7ADH0_9AGAM|nr:uncharacterized protein HD556DRAFT_1312969 [Suillus plorans]KAG1787137.1 hypothetical protein HD556DRAFT_1312969 [Suillus plorans]